MSADEQRQDTPAAGDITAVVEGVGKLRLAGGGTGAGLSARRMCLQCRSYAPVTQECRFNPPTSVPMERGMVTYFPVIPPDAWCSKFDRHPQA